MKASVFTIAALGAIFFAGLPTTAQAAEKLEGKTVVVPRATVRPNSSNPSGEGIYISSTTIGEQTSAPCYECGPVDEVAIPYPLVALAGGTPYYITVQLQDLGYEGFPTVNISLKENGTVFATSSVTFESPLQPGYVGLAYFLGTLPATTGVVTLSSTLTTSTGLQIAPGGAKFSIY